MLTTPSTIVGLESEDEIKANCDIFPVRQFLELGFTPESAVRARAHFCGLDDIPDAKDLVDMVAEASQEPSFNLFKARKIIKGVRERKVEL